MKNKEIRIELIIWLVLILLMLACQSKLLDYVNSFERFVERVEKNASSYSKEQWKRNDEHIQRYVERYRTEKTKLSVEEKRKVGELTVRYYKTRAKSFGFSILGEIDGWIDYLKGFVNETMKDINNYQNQ